LVLRAGDCEELERWTRASTVPAAAAKRARVVLLASEGVVNTRIAELADATVATVLAWLKRYQSKGMPGLADAPRPGRPRTLDHRQIVAETLKPPPRKLGVTHWSSRLLAERLGISNTSVARAAERAPAIACRHVIGLTTRR
jgi:transposase